MQYDSVIGDYKYWRTTISSKGIGVDDIIQYYLEVTYSDHTTTFVYGADGASQTTATQATAAASPFTIRNRAAYIYHNDNRAISGSNVTFTAKVGYVGKDGTTSSRWVNNGAIYYTIDGSLPVGSLGVAGTLSTTVLPLAFSQIVADSSVAGNAMNWAGTTTLPMYTQIRYLVGFWNSANKEEKFGDYNTTGTNKEVFSFSNGAVATPSLTINGVSADYTVTHVFINEINGDQSPLTILFDPMAAGVDPATVQVYTNLNRRDYVSLSYVDRFGITTEEGIQPPSGDTVGTDDSHYYKAYAMSPVTGGSGYQLTMQANKTGAYRLTARYKMASGVSPNPNPWIYYTADGRRDHAVVVSPGQARDVQLYEANALFVDATGDQPAQRSTFPDFSDSSKRWNLTYLKNLGCNWVWFQPIHPVGIEGRVGGDIGSPYSVKNFFEVTPLLGKNFTATTDPASNDPSPVAPTDAGYASSPRGQAKQDFINFVSAADAANVGIMLDVPFNHTAHDVEFGSNGVVDFAPTSGSAAYTSEIRNAEPRFFSQSGNYAARASSASTIALATDRGDFSKFSDVYDIYYGAYSALVDLNPDDDGNYLSAGDQFYGYFGGSAYPNGDPSWNSVDFTVNGVGSNVTRNTWHYFAQYVPYWLGQTGHGDASGNAYRNSTLADATQRLTADSKGIDGIRADFAQGLPPQEWEYIINVTRSYKWNFVFLAEALDGGAVTYRSSRHFDILIDNIVYAFQTASTAQNYRDIFDARRSAYGQGLILLNSTSADEQNYADPYQALIRYMVSGTIDGVPTIFYGQENGISASFGFDHFGTYGGKTTPLFETFNSLSPILDNQTYLLQQLYPDFAAVGQARQASTALRSSNRCYLDQTDGTVQESIFSVAKYDTANASPGVSDVVFGFVNLDQNDTQTGSYNVNVSVDGTNNVFGIHSGRMYNVKNIAAYLGTDSTRRGQFLISGGVSGDSLLAKGLAVTLNPVPTTDGAWSAVPFEAQYLKLYDVTPPPADSAPASAKAYALGNSATFTWAAVSDALGGIAGYRLIVSTDAAGNNVLFNTMVGNVTTYTINDATPGQTLYARVDAINNAGIEGPLSAVSAAVAVLDPNGDSDGDGVSNASEDLAGTDPLDPTSVFRVQSVVRNAGGSTVQITWSSVSGKKYEVDFSPDLSPGSFTAVSSAIIATAGTTTFAHQPSTAKGFYRVMIVP